MTWRDVSTTHKKCDVLFLSWSDGVCISMDSWRLDFAADGHKRTASIQSKYNLGSVMYNAGRSHLLSRSGQSLQIVVVCNIVEYPAASRVFDMKHFKLASTCTPSAIRCTFTLLH